jgi:hypothetical protein
VERKQCELFSKTTTRHLVQKLVSLSRTHRDHVGFKQEGSFIHMSA